MEKYFIQYNEALTLKELGFDEPCFGFWLKKDILSYPFLTNENTTSPAPLYQQAFEWFRTKHKLGIIIETLQNGCGHRCSIIVENPYHFINIDNRFDSYEEAELNCLRKLIEIIKTDYTSKFFHQKTN